MTDMTKSELAWRELAEKMIRGLIPHAQLDDTRAELARLHKAANRERARADREAEETE